MVQSFCFILLANAQAFFNLSCVGILRKELLLQNVQIQLTNTSISIYVTLGHYGLTLPSELTLTLLNFIAVHVHYSHKSMLALF